MRVQLHDLSTQEMLRGLRDAKLQVALLVKVPPEALRGLDFAVLQQHQVCVATHPSHPLFRAAFAREILRMEFLLDNAIPSSHPLHISRSNLSAAAAGGLLKPNQMALRP